MVNHKKVYKEFFDLSAEEIIPCEHCHKEQAVDVHHLKFRSEGGGDEIENLIGLCRECHNLCHAYSSFNSEVKHTLKTNDERKAIMDKYRFYGA